MKKLTFSLICLFMAVCFQANATIIRVDNTPGNLSTYSTAQSAHDNASAGDTLYFVGTGTNYGNLTMSKKLYIYGPGYFLASNPETQANPNDAQIITLNFNSGSAGSMVTGMHIRYLRINTNNIVVKRNYISDDNADYYSQIGLVGNSTAVSNIFIIQNVFRRYGGYNNSDYICLRIYGGCSNIFVNNNIIYDNNGWYSIVSSSSITVSHNVLRGILSTSNSIVDHNILETGSFSGSGNSVTYNIGNSTQFGTSNGNQSSVTMSNVFEYTGSFDGQFQLKSGSPAIGAGNNGVDIGAFGGVEPYVLSGMPAIPAIFYFSAPSTGSAPTGLPVNLKIKSHN